jgi:hypothetical protein
LLPHFTQECVDVTLDALGPHTSIGYEGITRSPRFALDFRVEDLVGEVAYLFAHTFQAIAEATTKFAPFFGR